MASRRRPSPEPADPLGPEEPTQVEDPTVKDGWEPVTPVAVHPELHTHDPPAGEFDTPVDVPFCHECGAVVILDDYTDLAMHAFPSHCLRARSGRWWWCAKFRKSVTYVPE